MRSYKGYVKDQPGFRLLYENYVMSLGHLYEEAYCYNKLTKEEIGIWQFQHDPTCGVVSKNNDWCLVGGEILILRTFFDRTVRPIGDLQDIHEIRLIDENTAQILIDPWSENAAVWQLDLVMNRAAPAFSLWKIKDFKDYPDKPYAENVNW
ncbi:hypothetical protein [Puia dinghuensis]|uniref:Uncharacterized protein n=1 Tax=Puia dinghuensis TaxID=1792502 RepID=A0A8J2XTD9_9BACT|nr:hypothetical protein [Puia dinghuensis]GGB03203.1 hypothetical protein GCM10011511_28100 [Puia dinghuensis]